MKPIESRIREAAKASNTVQETIERDFALSFVLAGIAHTDSLKESLIFKGGTALKKCYFGDYRFSEDLDFSTHNAPTDKALEKALQDAVAKTEKQLNELGAFKLELERYKEKHPHPQGQEAFKVGVMFPWQRRIICKIKLEISHHEPVLMPPVKRRLIHNYEDELSVEVNCYSLDEIVAEKMRTLLQTNQKLMERSWHRPRARDYYDLWRLLLSFGDELSSEVLPELLDKKATHVDVSYTSLDDFFTDELVSEAHKHWDLNLGQFVQDLPPCDQVLEELRELIPKFFQTLQ